MSHMQKKFYLEENENDENNKNENDENENDEMMKIKVMKMRMMKMMKIKVMKMKMIKNLKSTKKLKVIVITLGNLEELLIAIAI